MRMGKLKITSNILSHSKSLRLDQYFFCTDNLGIRDHLQPGVGQDFTCDPLLPKTESKSLKA